MRRNIFYFTFQSNQFERYPDNCSPQENCPRLGLGFWSKLGLVLGLRDNQTIVPGKNWPPVRVRVLVRVSFGVGGGGAVFFGGNCPRISLKETWNIKSFSIVKSIKFYSFDVKAIVTKKSRVTFCEKVRRNEMW